MTVSTAIMLTLSHSYSGTLEKQITELETDKALLIEAKNVLMQERAALLGLSSEIMTFSKNEVKANRPNWGK